MELQIFRLTVQGPEKPMNFHKFLITRNYFVTRILQKGESQPAWFAMRRSQPADNAQKKGAESAPPFLQCYDVFMTKASREPA
jgi:hypothetical protein